MKKKVLVIALSVIAVLAIACILLLVLNDGETVSYH